MPILIDSNVWLDVLTQDPTWFSWSSGVLAEAADQDAVCINPIVYAEISIAFAYIEVLEELLDPVIVRRHPLPYEAAFLAGKCFVDYRKRGGKKPSPLPDFFIGAHAAVMDWTLATRDAKRYRTYFPKLALIAPDVA